MKQDLHQLFEIGSEGLLDKKIENDEHSTEKQQVKKKTITFSKKWAIQENDVYISYLVSNPSEFQKEKTRRQLKTFKKMSILMQGTRSADQCRGHHKKMTEKYGGIEAIIKALTQKNQHLKKQRILREPKKKYTRDTLQRFDTNNTLQEFQQINFDNQENFERPILDEALVQDQMNSFDEQEWQRYLS